MNKINEPLEAFNGTWAILAAFCVVFLLIHLYQIGIMRHLTLRGWLFNLPIGMQLAVATMSVCAAIFISRSAIWYWRFFYHGDANALASQAVPLAVGAFLGCWSFLCILRVITRPFGIWPMAAAIMTVAAYWLTFLLF